MWRGKATGTQVMACSPECAKRCALQQVGGDGQEEDSWERRAQQLAQTKARMHVQDLITTMMHEVAKFMLNKTGQPLGDRLRSLDDYLAKAMRVLQYEVKNLPENAYRAPSLGESSPVGADALASLVVGDIADSIYRTLEQIASAVDALAPSLELLERLRKHLKDLGERRETYEASPSLWEEATDSNSLMSGLPRDVVRQLADVAKKGQYNPARWISRYDEWYPVVIPYDHELRGFGLSRTDKNEPPKDDTLMYQNHVPPGWGPVASKDGKYTLEKSTALRSPMFDLPGTAATTPFRLPTFGP